MIAQETYFYDDSLEDEKPMKSILPNDVARCDGLLPKKTRMPGGAEGILWVIDCPKRETCGRYLQMERDMERGEVPPNATYTSHFHGVDDACPDHLPAKEEAN